MATVQRDKIGITFTYDDYMDWLDDNDPQKLITEFSKWFTDKVTESIKLTQEPSEEQVKASEAANKSNKKSSKNR